MTLNKTNLQLVARAFGKRTGEWLGKTVTIFWDQSVFYAGQLVGGLRIRVPQSRVRTAAAAVTPEDPDDPIPF